MHRRTFLAGLAAMAPLIRAQAAALSNQARLDLAKKRLVEIEAREGGRLGVFVRDTGTGATIEHRADERFPMCSTFKLLAAAAALKRVDEGAERLDRTIAYGPSDLLEYAPVTKAHVAEGGMTLADLCAAAIDWSDNTAGKPGPGDDRRTVGLHAIRPLARRRGDAARPQRADAQRIAARRPARHHESARHGGRHAKSLAGRRAL